MRTSDKRVPPSEDRPVSRRRRRLVIPLKITVAVTVTVSVAITVVVALQQSGSSQVATGSHPGRDPGGAAATASAVRPGPAFPPPQSIDLTPTTALAGPLRAGASTPTGTGAPRASAVVTGIRTSYSGNCPAPADRAPQFQSVISVSDGPAAVRYRWTTSNGGSSDPNWHTVTFAGAGPQQQTVSYTDFGYLPDQMREDWVAVDISSPITVESNRVSYSVTCAAAQSPQVTATASAIRDTYTGPCPPTADNAPYFQGVISVSGGPVTVQYHWLTSNGGSSDPSTKTITFGGSGPQQQTVYFSQTSYLPNQTSRDWIALYTITPQDTQSNHVLFATTCSPGVG